MSTSTESVMRVYLSMGEAVIVSTQQTRNVHPKWNENHHFLVTNPETETLLLRIKDEKSSETLGSCDIRLVELLNETQLVLDRGFELVGLQSANTAKIYMRLSLKVEYFLNCCLSVLLCSD